MKKAREDRRGKVKCNDCGYEYREGDWKAHSQLKMHQNATDSALPKELEGLVSIDDRVEGLEEKVGDHETRLNSVETLTAGDFQGADLAEWYQKRDPSEL